MIAIQDIFAFKYLRCLVFLFHLLICLLAVQSVRASVIKIPFRYVQSFMIVEVKLESIVPMTLIFDTGAEQTIFFDPLYLSVFSDVYVRDISVFGSDLSQPIEAKLTRPLQVRFNEALTVRNSCIVLSDYNVDLRQKIGIPVQGILSASILRDYFIEIDYRAYEIILHTIKPQAFYLKKFTEHSISIVKNKPYISSQILMPNGIKKNLNLLIDTGAGLSALIYENSDASIQLPEHVVPSILGSGIGGAIEGVAGRINSFCIDSIYCLQDYIINFQVIESDYQIRETLRKQGLIGNHILDRFRIVLDYKDQKIYLRPNKNFNKKTSYDKSGIYVSLGGKSFNKYYVHYLIRPSPASVSGVEVGDEIIAINNWPVRLLSLQKIQNKLSAENGTKIKIKVNRSGKKLTKEFILENII